MSLPDRPSELLQLALDDLRKCEADPRFVIDMRYWLVAKTNTCHVCLAGSVMAQSLGANVEFDCSPGSFDRDTLKKLMALNYFRQGCIQLGYESLGRKRPTQVRRGWPAATYFDKEQFQQDMESLVKHLQEHGE